MAPRGGVCVGACFFSFFPPCVLFHPHPPVCSVVKLILATEDHHLTTNSISTVTCHHPEQGYLGKPSLWVGYSWCLPIADCNRRKVECYTNPTLHISPAKQASDLESTYGWFSCFQQKNRNRSQDGRLPGQQVPKRDCRTCMLCQMKGQNQGLHHSNLLSVGVYSEAYSVCSLFTLYVIRYTYKTGSNERGPRHLDKLSPKLHLKNWRWAVAAPSFTVCSKVV